MSILNFFSPNFKNYIVADEGADSNYAEYLLIAWLQEIIINVHQPVHILLFSRPKYCLEKLLQSAKLKNIEIQDYFNINLQDEESDIYEQLKNHTNQNSDSIIVIDCLSTLALQIGVAKACRFVEKLYQNHKPPVFCIYRRDICSSIPRIETLGDIYIKFEKSRTLSFDSNINYEVSVIHKKSGGGIAHWRESVKQNAETYKVEVEKITDKVKVENKSQLETKIEPQASFRIEMNESEKKQRDSVPLPYILPGNPGSGSKIIYVPDEIDDLDEEDPDDDLDF